MNSYEKTAFALNIILLVIIIAKLMAFWAVSSVMLIIVLIILLHKMNFDNAVEDVKEDLKKRNSAIDNTINQVDSVSKSILRIRNDLRKILFSLEQRLEAQRINNEIEMKRNYRELAGKIIDIENRMNSEKKMLTNYISHIEENMREKSEL